MFSLLPEASPGKPDTRGAPCIAEQRVKFTVEYAAVTESLDAKSARRAAKAKAKAERLEDGACRVCF